MRTITRIPVRYAETDKMAVVYHAHYLVYFEVARTDFLAQCGHDWASYEDQGFVSPVLEATVKYKSPLRYGDIALVETWVSALKPTRIEYSYAVYASDEAKAAGKAAAIGTTQHCIVDAATGKPQSMKKVMPVLYEQYQSILES